MREEDKRIERLFALAARDSASKTHLLLSDGTAVTYAQTYQRARQLASVLVANGVQRGDRVACVMRNSRELVEFYIACGLCGAISVALNTLSTAREIERYFQDCEPVGVLVQQCFEQTFNNAQDLHSLKFKILVGGQAGSGWQDYEPQLNSAVAIDDAQLWPNDEAAIMIYSSGTTGLPKGILLSHQALIDNALAAVQVLDYRADDVFMTILPMFSSFGFAFDLLHVAINRASVVILEKFDEHVALDLLERFRVSFLGGVPTMFARMFDPANMQGRDLSSLRLVDVGGGPVSKRLKKMLKEEVGTTVVESYGLTEISPVASVQRASEQVLSSSCGAPLPGIEVRVVDSNGNDMPAGEPGELIFSSSTLMLGYWNQPEQTAQSLRGGWLYSGDVGIVDDNGEIHIMDRTKDMIVTNGFNVYPKEVENVIAEISQVQAVAVVGRPDEIRGELIHAFVVPKHGQQLSEQDVLDHCFANLSRFKVPRGVTLLQELPLTASGKIQRFRLRELLNEVSKQ